MAHLKNLEQALQQQFSDYQLTTTIAYDELTVEVDKAHLCDFCQQLRDLPQFKFEQLMDLCGVDYLHYGQSEWTTEEATLTGFSRGVTEIHDTAVGWHKPRFAVVYHLLSLTHNRRLRIRVFPDEANLIVDSVVDIWNVANFFEREAFDLYGILFNNHPDLRRVLTDYGFVGHPFRKDFPLIGHVEPRFDAAQNRVVYEPVSIESRTLVPKVIRQDNRYETGESEE
jgi:NADH-quinone oxidoreductase subunit C